jgi:hypothetical protein
MSVNRIVGRIFPEKTNKKTRKTQQQQTPWLSVRKRNIPTDRPPLTTKCRILQVEDVAWSAHRIPSAVNISCLVRYFALVTTGITESIDK